MQNKFNLILKVFISATLALGLIAEVSFASSKGGHCHNNFNFRAANAPHNIPQQVLEKLKELADNNQPMEGWKLLGQYGDRYAAIAHQVLNPNASFPYSGYRKLITNHWVNAAGYMNFHNKFSLVAAQHFKQYVSIVLKGSYPDSDQVINSYYQAVRTYGLPDATVFDGAWEAAGMNGIATWQELNKLTGNRLVNPSRACNKISTAVAIPLMTEDFTEATLSIIYDMLKI